MNTESPHLSIRKDKVLNAATGLIGHLTDDWLFQ